MMPFVVDASLAVAWVVADERNSAAEVLLKRVKVDGGRVPDLFWHEMRNLLLKIERRGRSPRGAAEIAVFTLRRLPIAVLINRDDASILDLAQTHKLTAYDAAYLDLAIGFGLPLATADRQLADAAGKAGVPVLGPYTFSTP